MKMHSLLSALVFTQLSFIMPSEASIKVTRKPQSVQVCDFMMSSPEVKKLKNIQVIKECNELVEDGQENQTASFYIMEGGVCVASATRKKFLGKKENLYIFYHKFEAEGKNGLVGGFFIHHLSSFKQGSSSLSFGEAGFSYVETDSSNSLTTKFYELNHLSESGILNYVYSEKPQETGIVKKMIEGKLKCSEKKTPPTQPQDEDK